MQKQPQASVKGDQFWANDFRSPP